VNVVNATAAPQLSYISTAQMPIWNFVPRGNNEFSIRNDTSRRYLTEANNHLWHSEGAGANNNQQRWLLMPQPDGTYRVRSVSNPALYLTHTGMLNLALRNRAGDNSQLWHIENIWHIGDRYPQDYFSYWWPGTIFIYTEYEAFDAPASLDFTSRMASARTIWTNALGVRFDNAASRDTANILAFGGCRHAIATEVLGENGHFPPSRYRYGVMLSRAGYTDRNVTVRAGGVDRKVFRLNGSGANASIAIVFTNTGAENTYNRRNINFATMTAIHELGHALGYNGHSPNSQDIMRSVIEPYIINPVLTLRPAELWHLGQIYWDPRFGSVMRPR